MGLIPSLALGYAPGLSLGLQVAKLLGLAPQRLDEQPGIPAEQKVAA